MKRLHIHISVPELQQAIDFYRALFDQAPDVTKPDYAKWMLDDPAVNFAISVGHGKKGVNHLGFQFDSDEAVDDIQQRLRAAHIKGMDETDVNCCYANSNKYWTVDTAGIAWEQFHTLSEIPTFGDRPQRDDIDTHCGCGPAAEIKSGIRSCCA